jgi:GTP-binding protein
MARRDHQTFEISAATGQGVPALLNAVGALLREVGEQERAAKAKADKPQERRRYTLEDADERAWRVVRQARHRFEVTGVAIERFTKMTNFDLEEGVERFQKALEASGISKELVRQGIEPGDVVHLAGHELIWDESSILEPENRRRSALERKLARKR